MTITIKPVEEVKPLAITVPNDLFGESSAHVKTVIELTYPQMTAETKPFKGGVQDRSKLFLNAYNMAMNDVDMQNNFATPNALARLTVFDTTDVDILSPIAGGYFITTITDYAITYALATVARLGGISFLEHLRFHINVDFE